MNIISSYDYGQQHYQQFEIFSQATQMQGEYARS